MTSVTLPADVWLYMADNYLRKQDCLHLSRTARIFRAYFLPYVFRTLRFNGHIVPTKPDDNIPFHDHSETMYFDITPEAYLGYLQFNLSRIAGLKTPKLHLLGLIKSVELWNWAYIPPSLLLIPPSTGNSKEELRRVSSPTILMRWLLTYQKIIEFVVKLPAIRTLVFHECEYGRGLHGDALPFGLTTILPSTETLGGGYTPCEWLHYSCENLSPASFKLPRSFLNRSRATDSRIKLRRKYLLEVLNTCQLPLVKFRHTVAMIFSGSDTDNWKDIFHSPERLSALALTTDNGWDTFRGERLNSLFAKFPNLIALELPTSFQTPLNDNLFPPTLIPKLQSICAPGNIALQIVPGRPLHTIRLRQPDNSIWYFRLRLIQKSTTAIKLLDLTDPGLRIWASQLMRALLLKVVPDLEVLLVAWSTWTDKRRMLPHSPKTLIYDILRTLVSLQRLRKFVLTSVPIDAAMFPTESQPLSFFMNKKIHPSLEIMYLGPEVQLVWKPDLGWINIFPKTISLSAVTWHDNELYVDYLKSKAIHDVLGEKVKAIFNYLSPKKRSSRKASNSTL